MWQSKRFNIVIALIAAIVLWAYVLGNVNPVSTETIRNIPIIFINEDKLEDRDLLLFSKDYETVNITYSGQRTVTSKIKESSFKVLADVGNLEEGSYSVELQFIAPDGITIENTNLQKVDVVVDTLVNEPKKVTVVVVNNSEFRQVEVSEMSTNSVGVSGPSVLVDSVSYAKAVLDASKVIEDGETVDLKLVPVNGNGNEVSDIILDTTSMWVKVKVSTIVENEEATETDAAIDETNNVEDENEGDAEVVDTPEDEKETQPEHHTDATDTDAEAITE